MNIKTSSLKAFQKLAGNIKPNSILHAVDYLKFEPGKITKSAFSSFIQFDCEGIDETLLVDEKQLFNILNVTNSDFLNISKKGNKTTISDTRDKLSFQAADIVSFPVIPEIIGDTVALSQEFKEALHMAAFFPLRVETIPTAKSFVMVGKRTICSSDGFIAFHSSIEEDITLVLDKNIAAMVSKLSLTGFANGDNYYFFFFPGVTMGFSTQEIGFTDMNVFFPKEKRELSFVTSSDDLNSFNSLAMKAADNCLCIMSKDKIRMDNSMFHVHLEREVTGIDIESEFYYNPEQMNRLMAAIECEELEFYEADRMFYIKSGDYKFSTLIMKINKPVTA